MKYSEHLHIYIIHVYILFSNSLWLTLSPEALSACL